MYIYISTEPVAHKYSPLPPAFILLRVEVAHRFESPGFPAGFRI